VDLREVHDPRGFLRGHFFTEPKPENFEFPWRKQPARAVPQTLGMVLMFELARRRRRIAYDVGGHVFPFFVIAKMIEGRAARDGQEPVNQRARAVERTDVMVGFQESLLGEILGVLTMAYHVAEVTKNAAVMCLHELVESPGVAGSSRADRS